MFKNNVAKIIKRIFAIPVWLLFCILNAIIKPFLWGVKVAAAAAAGFIIYKLYIVGILFELFKLGVVFVAIIVLFNIPTQRIASKVNITKYRLNQLVSTGEIVRFKADFLYK